MNEFMTVEEMETRFPREWILIGDPDTDENLRVKGGCVLFHSKDRDEMYQVAVQRAPKHCAVWYTGPLIEEGMSLLL